MGRYVARRLLQLIPVFFGTTFLIFALVFAMPGDPLQRLAGEKALDPGIQAQLVAQYHLDEPLVVQYGYYIGGVLTGDFGTTYTGRSVTEIMAERWPVTLRLALMAFAIEVLVGISAGVWAGLRAGRAPDAGVLLLSLVVISIPVFVLGFVMQWLFGIKLTWFPPTYSTLEPIYSLVLPAVVLASLSLAYVARLTRTSLVENLRADYVRTAIAKGLPRRRVIGRHALRNSLIGVVTFLGADLGGLMGGAVVTEGIFNVPGIGGQLYQSVRLGEAVVVVGIVTALVVIYLLVNLAVDLLYALLDPRIRYE